MPPRKRPKCPHPNKMCFRDEIAAKIVIITRQSSAHRREFTETRAYKCKCGWWHTTSDEKP